MLNIKPAQVSPVAQLNDIVRCTIHDCASQSIPVRQWSALLLQELQWRKLCNCPSQFFLNWGENQHRKLHQCSILANGRMVVVSKAWISSMRTIYNDSFHLTYIFCISYSSFQFSLDVCTLGYRKSDCLANALFVEYNCNSTWHVCEHVCGQLYANWSMLFNVFAVLLVVTV